MNIPKNVGTGMFTVKTGKTRYKIQGEEK